MNPLGMRHMAVALLVAAFAGPAWGQDAVTLQYKLNKGDQLIFNIRSEVEQVQTVMGMDLNNELNSEQWVVRTVDQVDPEGDVHLNSETRRLKVEAVFGPLGAYTFDSESDDHDTASVIGAAATPVFERLSGAMLQVVVSPKGKVKKVDGYKELLADVLANNPLASQFAGGGSDAAAALEMQQQFLELPAKAVSPGDTWEAAHSFDLPAIGSFKSKTKYRYLGPDQLGGRSTAKIQATTDLSVEIDIKSPANEVSGTLSTSNSSATIHFDVERGRLLSIEDTYSLEGDLTVTAGGNMIPVHQEQTQKVSVRLLDKLPE